MGISSAKFIALLIGGVMLGSVAGPTTAEVGYPAAAYEFWNGLFVPVKTPQDIVAKLHQETQKAIVDPAVKDRLDKVGVQPLVMTQAEFQKYFENDVKETDKLAQAAGIEKQ